MKRLNFTYLPIAVAVAGLTLSSAVEPQPQAPAISITISEPGFEADGNWKIAKTGASVAGLYSNDMQPNYTKAGLIDANPYLGRMFAYNNGPDQDVYQVLDATVATNTTYKLSVVAIDSTASNPFPGGELRLGYVSDSPTPQDDFSWNLMTPAKVDNPLPFNDHENAPETLTDGAATWTWTFTTGATPVGLGQKLRVEILGGGKPQAIFDNVRLQSSAATPAEIEAALKAASAIKTTKARPIVVMFGDSTTDGGMAPAVQKEFNKLISSELNRPQVINAGKGGDNATAALARIEKDVLAHKPDIVTVSFGLNDTGGRKPDQFKDSLKNIIRSLKDADIQVLLMTSTPFNNEKHFWGKDFEKDGGLDEYMDKQFCEKMRSLAHGKNVLICDLHSIFQAEIKKDPELINQVISADGVHLTAEGYLLISKHVAPNILKLLDKN